MGKRRNLKAALDNYKGKDYALERQKKLQKNARKVKEERTQPARKKDEGPQTSGGIDTVFGADDGDDDDDDDDTDDDDDDEVGSNEDLVGEEDESMDDDVGGVGPRSLISLLFLKKNCPWLMNVMLT